MKAQVSDIHAARLLCGVQEARMHRPANRQPEQIPDLDEAGVERLPPLRGRVDQAVVAYLVSVGVVLG